MRLRITLALLSLSAAAHAGVMIQMIHGGFQVTGWNPSPEPAEGWSSIFSVYGGTGDVPAMTGAYAVDNGALVFHPKWPVAAGVHVRAVFHPAGAPAVEATFDTARPDLRATTRVDHVYPSTDELPSNALRLYINFSAAMQRGEAWRHIHLLDGSGKPVELPFLEIDQELWDPGNTRLTVLFDPGRIKRGLLPLEESGPNIVEGRKYTLWIDAGWLDATGTPLIAEYRKPLRVIGAERSGIDPSAWKIAVPKAGSKDPLVLDFPKPLDYALMLRLVTVEGVTGTASAEHDETEWRFIPDAPWKAGSYTVTINTNLEDLAGNQVGRAFDVDTFNEVTKDIRKQTVSLPFHVGQ